MLMALYKVQIAIILHWAIVAIEKASFRLGILSSFSPMSLHNLLHSSGDGFRS
jgi:hypothetical protein